MMLAHNDDYQSIRKEVLPTIRKGIQDIEEKTHDHSR